ncbi:MAG: metallophosphoesterase, partial [Deltaproteobacteria bacterium]|nr:metallophosphoesterase [Deltaproteobacteria bacterium]
MTALLSKGHALFAFRYDQLVTADCWGHATSRSGPLRASRAAGNRLFRWLAACDAVSFGVAASRSYDLGLLFAIGDVHGCAQELRMLLNELPLGADSKVVFVGDYIDRGPDSKGVIDTILELSKQCE